MNIYVGNLPFQLREEELSALFSTYGEVTSVKIMTDRETGRSRGFAFVEMTNDEEALLAIERLHESDLKQRTLVVNEAKPRSNDGERRGGGGGGGRQNQRRSGGGGGGYNNRY
jgi:cold-inducible RNA-binding protein